MTMLILENVRLSGSAQYSKNSLEKIIQEIKQHQKDNSPIAIIDVRQEMHLLGGSALSDVIAEKDWSEINHKIESILNDENKLVQPGLMEREETVAKSLNLNYLRLLVTDDSIPNEKALDLFVKFFKEQIEKNPKVWFHVHCEHGHGRTTTFMTLVHILNTNGQVKLGEILKEQYDHGKVDLSFPTIDQQKIKDVDLQRTRFAFLEEFHQYVNDKESGFYSGKSWSDWKKSVSE